MRMKLYPIKVEDVTDEMVPYYIDDDNFLRELPNSFGERLLLSWRGCLPKSIKQGELYLLAYLTPLHQNSGINIMNYLKAIYGMDYTYIEKEVLIEDPVLTVNHFVKFKNKIMARKK